MLKEGFLFTFISAFMALFPVANPVGAGFLVNGLLSGLNDEDRRSIIRRIVTDYLLVGLGSLAVGHFVLTLFGLSLPVIQLGGALLVLVFVVVMLFTNSYRLIEKWIIAFVSIIGLSFIYELSLVTIDWPQAARAWVTPSFPEGSMVIIMSVLGAVVMPHNLFLHSEVIQSRQWNLSDDAVIRRQLRYEYADTIFSMLVGWAINSAMILLAAATFFVTKTPVEELQQADSLLQPLLGRSATHIFAVALLFAGIFKEPYDIRDNHSRTGVMVSLVVAFLIILLIGDPFKGLIYSQMILSIQLPFTVFLQVHLTSSERVMGKYRNSRFTKYLLYGIGAVVTVLNVMLLVSFFR